MVRTANDLTPAITNTLAGITTYISATADPSREDRLWPASYHVFETNPLSVAYGATGIALFLRRNGLSLSNTVRDWLLARPLSVHLYPPGLFVGLAGLAYVFAECGLTDRAEAAISLCYASPLRFRDPTMFHGAAGWGLVSLYFYERTGREEYLNRAKEAAHYLLKSAEKDGDFLCWTSAKDDKVNHGYGYGSSGIAMFLASAGVAMQRTDFIEAGVSAFEFDLTNHGEDQYGWTWPATKGHWISLPYWGHGSSGVGTAAVRLHRILSDSRYLRIATTIAESSFVKWSALPNLVDGLSGIGEYMLDMYAATGDQEYLGRAQDIAETVLVYRVTRPEGITFPGRWLNRVSTDLATGSAGIGLFLHRLLTLGDRSLVDLYGPSSLIRPRTEETQGIACGHRN